MQLVPYCALYLPLAHEMQLVLPDDDWYWPLAHEKQYELLSYGWYLPLAHESHLELPVEAYLPRLQSRHLLSVERERNLPAGHATQVPLPSPT
jgi:hypothetical protein